MVKMRFISVICGLGVFPLPISIDNRVVCKMIKGTSPQFPINLNHLSLASLTWIQRTLRSYQISCHLFAPASYNWKILKLELNTLPCSLLPPVLQPNSTSISRTPNSHNHSTVTARSYWPQKSFQIGSIPQVYLHQIKTPGNIDAQKHAWSNEGRPPKDPNNDSLRTFYPYWSNNLSITLKIFLKTSWSPERTLQTLLSHKSQTAKVIFSSTW